MKNTYLLFYVLLFSIATIFAQNKERFKLIDQSTKEINISYQQGSFEQKNLQINNESYITINDQQGTPILAKGTPDLPKLARSVIIPNSGKVSLEYSFNGFTDYNNVLIAPSKGNLMRNVNPKDIPHTFGKVYATDAFYPGKLAEIKSPYILRDYRGATVTVYPYQYNPITKTLRVYKNLKVKVTTNTSLKGINEVKSSNTKLVKPYQDVYKKHFLNNNASLKSVNYTPKGESGNMLIITKDEFADEIAPLANWKIQKGIKTTVVNVSTIGNNHTSIKNYISSAYTNDPNLLYVLFIGDHAGVCCYNAGNASTGETNWSDTKYAYITGNDFYPELFVGRFSGETSEEITTQVNRTLEYEKTPIASEYYKNAIGLASDEGAGQGDDNEADWQHSRNLGTKLLAYGFNNYFEFYDGDHGGNDAAGNPTAAIISPKMNDGASLLFYTGHGDQNTCISGNYGNSDITSGTNNGKYPFVISVACNNGTFATGTCISETWVRAKNASGPIGSIATAGSTILMAWTPPMQTQDEIVEIMTEAYANNKKYTLGGIFYNSQMSMLDNYATEGKEVMDTWVLFGDPSAVIRTANPALLTATHVAVEAEGIDHLAVNCTTNGALISVTQNGVILGTGLVSGGTIDITFSAAITTTDDLTVTATKYNHKPYQGAVDINTNLSIADLSENLFIIYPNPCKDILTINLNSNELAHISIIDIIGRTVYSNKNTTQQSKINTNNFSNGTYFVKVSQNNKNVIKKLIVK